MPTIQEIVERDLNLGTSEASHVDSDPAMTKIAEEMGFYSEEGSEGENANHEKTAGDTSMDSLYNELFPEDEVLGKQASASDYEEKLGMRAYDYFAERMDQRIEKIAAEVASISDDNPHQDSRPPQTQPDNSYGLDGKKIDTTPQYTDEVSKENDERTVGDYEQKKSAALRKAYLVSLLD